MRINVNLNQHRKHRKKSEWGSNERVKNELLPIRLSLSKMSQGNVFIVKM